MKISMFSPRVRASLAALLAVGGLALADTAAQAQAPIRALETYNPVDGNGVNLLSGSMTASTPTISIGPKGGGLSYSQSYDSSDGWSESVSSMVMWSGANWSTGPDPWYTVTLMGRSIAFKKTGSTFTPSEGDNAGLVFDGTNYTLTLADGTVAVYAQIQGFNPGTAVAAASLTGVTYPNGRQITFNYANLPPYGYRVQSVTSSDGYQLHFDYASNSYDGTQGGPWRTVTKVTALNNAVDGCAPLALTCTYSRTWPSLTLAWSGTTYLATDALGRTTRYFFNGMLSGIRRPGRATGYDVQVYYNGESQMVEQVTTDQGNYTYAIPDAYKNGFPAAPNQVTTNSATQVTDPLNHTRIVTSRSILVDLATKHRVSRLRATTDGAGGGATYGYDSSFRLTSISPIEGKTQSITYDARGNISQTQSGDNIVTATYPATCDATNFRICNQPDTVTDARSGVTTFKYDPAHGGVVQVTSPAPTTAPGVVKPQARTTYAPFQAWYKSAAGTIVQDARVTYLPTGTSACATLGPAVDATPAPCVGTADEVKTTTAYQVGNASTASNLLAVSVTSGNGLPSTDSAALAATTVMTYEDTGDVRTVDGPLSGTADTTRTFYDAMRQPTGVIGPDPDGTGGLLFRGTRTTYNADGQVTSVETGTATSQADMATFSPLQTAVTAYDGSGRKTADSLVVGGVTQTLTQYGYDADNRLICSAVRMNPTGSQPASACTPTLGGADGNDRVTFTEYDAANRVTQITSGYGANSRVEKTVTYFADGREKTVADGKGNLTTYEYDDRFRLAKVRYPVASGTGSSNTDYETYGYDAADNRTSWRRRDGTTVAFTYDALNRAQNGLRGEVYAYDNLGRKTSATYAGQTASAAFDAMGRMKTETTNGWTMSYQYDLAGRRTRITWPDAVYVNYEYNTAGQMQNIWNSAGTRIWAIAYDNLGRASYGWSGPGAPATQTSYAYDAASRLQSLSHDLAGTANDQTWTFAYNAAGQVKTRTASNSLYEWSAVQASKTYTVNGLNQYATVAGATIAYDGRGNLANDGTKAYGYDLLNNLTSAGTTSLAYEPTGRLWAVTSGGTATGFVYSGSDLVAEVSGSGQILRRYVPGPGTDAPIVWYEGATTAAPRWLLADPQGSIVSVVNGDGTVVATNTYDEYGVPAGGNQGRFQYTGQIWLPEVGLYHYKARAYSPTLGRFLQTDPTGYDDGLNWYAYVGNDPLNKGDPAGTQSMSLEAGREIAENRILEKCGSSTACVHAETDKLNQREAKVAGAQLTVITGVIAPLGSAAKAAATEGAAALATNEAATAAVQTTVHGAERIAGAGATRGGVLSAEGVAATRQSGQVLTQADGAKVFVSTNEAGRFNIVVQNTQGKVITTFENLSQKSMGRLSKNYGWQ